MCTEVWKENCHPKLHTPMETLLENSSCPFFQDLSTSES